MLPQKKDPIQVRITVGENLIEYPGKLSAKTTDLTTFKIHISSVISTGGLRYARWDIVNYYLETPMGWSKYMIIHIRLIPPDIITNYSLNNLWMDLHGYYTRNVRTTTSENPCKQLTRTAFNQPWIL